MPAILIVDDEIKLLEVLSVALENMGYEPVTAERVEDALRVLDEREIHLVLSDLRLPGMSGRDLLEKIKARDPGLPVVIMTAYAALKDAVEIIKEGAFDYIVKPFDLDALEATVASALRFRAVSADNTQLRRELGRAFDGENLVGESPAIREVRQKIREAAASSANVLVTGESGTGKVVVAKAIHYAGPRAAAPFVTVNCAAIPDSLLESELFGHVKGAFTGATADRPGRFAQADSGSLFLDEIGDMAPALQAKILRCIQEKTIEPVGGRAPRKVDTRIIAATNQDLLAAASRGMFRQDLYYRLNVYPIFLPALRDRKEDIPLLAGHFAAQFAARSGAKPVSFSAEALAALAEYHWPGIVRELENGVERLSIVMPGGLVTPEKLAACLALPVLGAAGSGAAFGSAAGSFVGSAPGSSAAGPPCSVCGSAPGSLSAAPLFPLDLDRRLEEAERDLILRALEHAGGVQVKAAELLRISERSIWHRIKKLGIAVLNKREVS